MKKIALATLLVASLFGADHVINQKGKTFIPHEVTVKVGDTLTFLNSDPFAHNTYTDDEANEFDIGMQASGTKKTVTIKAPGQFSVECAIHPNMLLEVTAK
ncbi:plastocyanin/azurin family copper-binding protein [Sulfurimonas sp.]|uniref:plastocyanin/azurin family copper-binding protein n=1 Tax=Sulfurimonas sp. TaxID=2022749 RepID=UPI002607F71A|nr:plastocyanin/azurin family copper-binding protein [Sulfurimonas sp.]